jgi:hypothetical protein
VEISCHFYFWIHSELWTQCKIFSCIHSMLWKYPWPILWMEWTYILWCFIIYIDNAFDSCVLFWLIVKVIGWLGLWCPVSWGFLQNKTIERNLATC